MAADQVAADRKAADREAADREAADRGKDSEVAARVALGLEARAGAADQAEAVRAVEAEALPAYAVYEHGALWK